LAVDSPGSGPEPASGARRSPRLASQPVSPETLTVATKGKRRADEHVVSPPKRRRRRRLLKELLITNAMLHKSVDRESKQRNTSTDVVSFEFVFVSSSLVVNLHDIIKSTINLIMRKTVKVKNAEKLNDRATVHEASSSDQ
jgi:hypothetical protein